MTPFTRLSNLPTRSEWQTRLKYFYFHQDEFLQGHLRSCAPDVLFAYSILVDLIQSSLFRKVGGCLCYSRSLDFETYVDAISCCISIDLLINTILNIDSNNYTTYISRVESSESKYFVVTISLYTTLEVCA